MRRVARHPLDFRRAILAAFFLAVLGTAPAGATSPQFRRVGTIDAATATANQACYWNGADLECNSTNPTITATGLVGIGTTNPTYMLQVGFTSPSVASNGAIVIANSNGSGGQRYMKLGYDSNYNFGLFDSASTMQFGINYAAPANSLYINAAGNVGIGTASPTLNLQVSQSSGTTTTPAAIGFTGGSTGTASRLTLDPSGSGLQVAWSDRMQLANFWGIEVHGQTQNTSFPSFTAGTASDASLTVFGTNGNSNPAFQVVNNAGSSTFLTVTGTGSVGIGTTAPAANVKADINGMVKVAGTGSEPCGAAQVGSMRYNPTGNYFELCSYP